jgi:hypothetical protein
MSVIRSTATAGLGIGAINGLAQSLARGQVPIGLDGAVSVI